MSVSPNKDVQNGSAELKATRQGTMETTAQEGIAFLKDQQKETLLEAQGLIPPRGDAAEKNGHHANGTSNGNSNGNSPSKLAKANTMVATAAEGEEILDGMGGPPDPDARTRGQANAIDGITKEVEENGDEPSPKKAKREGTMEQTAKEGAEWLAENAKKDQPVSPKKTHTMEQTVKEGEEFVHRGENVSPKRTGTMQQTIADGNEFLERGQGGEGLEDDDEDDDEVDDEEDIDEEEEGEAGEVEDEEDDQ